MSDLYARMVISKWLAIEIWIRSISLNTTVDHADRGIVTSDLYFTDVCLQAVLSCLGKGDGISSRVDAVTKATLRPSCLTSNYLYHVSSHVFQYFEGLWLVLADHCFLFEMQVIFILSHILRTIVVLYFLILYLFYYTNETNFFSIENFDEDNLERLRLYFH